MYCWGSNRDGQLGLGGVEDETSKAPVDNKFFQNKRVKQVACGFNHTIFLLDDGTLYACGNNDFEQLGHDGPRRKPEQIKLLEVHYIVQVACGHSFSMAVNNRGQLFCWGSISGLREGDLFFAKPM